MSDLRIGVIGVPGKWSTEVLADAIQLRTGFRLVIDMATVRADLMNRTLWSEQVDLCQLDGLVVKKISQQYSPHTLDRIELLRLAEQAGVKIFSKPATIIRMIDRLGCTVTLRNADIPMPDTTVTEDRIEALTAVRRYGQAIFKPLYSTKARGMQVINSERDDSVLLAQIDTFRDEHPMMYIQQKVDLAGRDFGMVFLGGEYLGSYARVGQNESWNTTIESGGKYAPHDPPPGTVELARQAQALFDMDFTTVDVADTPAGPIVFEVSAFGGFRGARDGIGIDAADLYADHVLRKLSQ